MTLYEPDAAFATQPGSLTHGLPGVRGALDGFIAMKGALDLKVTRVLEAGGLWRFVIDNPWGTAWIIDGGVMHTADALGSVGRVTP